MKKIFEYYMNNKLLRNLSALLMDLFIIILMSYSIYYSLVVDVKNINWYLLILAFIVTIALRFLSCRIRIVHVCPECKQNRGISEHLARTGNYKNYQKYVSGDYWCYSQDVEYIKTMTCRYCNFYDETFYWQNETWQGDLTEEAKIRKESEARRKAIEQQQVAQTQAIINAYDRIRERRY